MEGFDVVLLGNFYALPQFQKAYGKQLPSGEYQITATWQAGLSNGANVGEIIGLCINGWASERFGYKRTMCTAVIVLAKRGKLSGSRLICYSAHGHDLLHFHPFLCSEY